MSFNENILLKLRREFSGQEKYRLFLQHLNQLEDNLRAERNKATKLTKANALLISHNSQLLEKNRELRDSLAEYDKREIGKACVKLKTHERAIAEKKKWEELYIKTFHELQDLKNQINATAQTKQDAGVPYPSNPEDKEPT